MSPTPTTNQGGRTPWPPSAQTAAATHGREPSRERLQVQDLVFSFSVGDYAASFTSSYGKSNSLLLVRKNRLELKLQGMAFWSENKRMKKSFQRDLLPRMEISTQ